MNVEEVHGNNTASLAGAEAARGAEAVDATAANKQRTDSSVNKADEASLSKRAHLMAKLRTEFDKTDDVRADKVEELRSRVEAGEYKVEVGKLVEKLFGMFE